MWQANKKHLWIVSLFSFSLLMPGGTFAATLAAGPMPGHSSPRSVSLWLQTTAPAKVSIEYWPVGELKNKQRTARILTQTETKNTARIDINALQPGTRYQYRVLINNKKRDFAEATYFSTQALRQKNNTLADFSVALGSCAYINDKDTDRPGRAYGDGFSIFNTIASQQPDMMLWLGDNIYLRRADYSSPAGIAYRYNHVRAFKPLQRLLRSTHHYAIWDDHDFGPNNSNSAYVFKQQALAMFKQYWANPSYGLKETAGVFTQFSFNDVDFFLLDNRYYRDHPGMPDDSKQMLGAEQLHWLQNALLSSSANFKLIAGGGQFINQRNKYEGWHDYPQEQKRFLQWLKNSNIKGVIFLSGDRHHSELLKIERDGHYSLYELTCSPLTSGSHKVSRFERKNPQRITGTLVEQRNFCLLEFSGQHQQRQLSMKVLDAAGTELWQRSIKQLELQ